MPERDMTHIVSVITNWRSKAQKLADEHRHNMDGPVYTAKVVAYQQVLDLLTPGATESMVPAKWDTTITEPDPDILALMRGIGRVEDVALIATRLVAAARRPADTFTGTDAEWVEHQAKKVQEGCELYNAEETT